MDSLNKNNQLNELRDFSLIISEDELSSSEMLMVVGGSNSNDTHNSGTGCGCTIEHHE